jgi:hypothetical protein
MVEFEVVEGDAEVTGAIEGSAFELVIGKADASRLASSEIMIDEADTLEGPAVEFVVAVMIAVASVG